MRNNKTLVFVLLFQYTNYCRKGEEKKSETFLWPFSLANNAVKIELSREVLICAHLLYSIIFHTNRNFTCLYPTAVCNQALHVTTFIFIMFPCMRLLLHQWNSSCCQFLFCHICRSTYSTFYVSSNMKKLKPCPVMSVECRYCSYCIVITTFFFIGRCKV